MLMLRTMQKARYAPENLGHFGLAFASYTHFTSPIRRYPDLVVHRLLRARAARRTLTAERRERAGGGRCPRSRAITSERERRADEAERELRPVEEGPVHGATRSATSSTATSPASRRSACSSSWSSTSSRGWCTSRRMADDYYRFLDADAHAARREHAARSTGWATACACRSSRVDLDTRQIELGLVEILEARPRRRRRAARGRRAAEAEAAKPDAAAQGVAAGPATPDGGARGRQ